jgi:hypothetical protein
MVDSTCIDEPPPASNVFGWRAIGAATAPAASGRAHRRDTSPPRRKPLATPMMQRT